jgi:hypothetical protein
MGVIRKLSRSAFRVRLANASVDRLSRRLDAIGADDVALADGMILGMHHPRPQATARGKTRGPTRSDGSEISGPRIHKINLMARRTRPHHDRSMARSCCDELHARFLPVDFDAAEAGQ